METVTHSSEADRLASLYSLHLLDTAPDERFDRITRLALDLFQLPISYIALLDQDRQWFKSRQGICALETRRDESFCHYTIQQDEPLIIPDTYLNAQWKEHSMVLGEPFARFYAGVPLYGPEKMKIGTFCLMDTQPREFSSREMERLRALAAIVEHEINLGSIIQMQSDLLKTREALNKMQEHLRQEMTEAALYVRSMLPPPLQSTEMIDWYFQPSEQLGGDGLGYRIIDEDRIAFYVLDVSGHGLGSALMAVTALEMLRSRTIKEIDYGHPAKIVERLNRTFQMRDHSGKYLSIWYGVYSRRAGQITYANAGHPPALLIQRRVIGAALTKTAPGGPIVGVLSDMTVPETTLPFGPENELYLFTDGLYELKDGRGGHTSYEEFMNHLEEQSAKGTHPWAAIQSWHENARSQKRLDDDVTLLRFYTRS